MDSHTHTPHNTTKSTLQEGDPSKKRHLHQETSPMESVGSSDFPSPKPLEAHVLGKPDAGFTVHSNESDGTSDSTSSDSDDTSSDEEMIISVIENIVIPMLRRDRRVPRNTSALQRRDWVAEILMASDSRFYDNVRMRRPIFYSLVKLLTERGLLADESPQTRVSNTEAVLIFIRTVAMDHRQRDSMERFQHSFETINRHVLRVKHALLELATEFVGPPNFNHVDPSILNTPCFYPYFGGAVGALDGTLIPAWVSQNRQNSNRSQKHTISQNVLAICDFNLLFTYVYAGWEGSASDAHILRNAVHNDPTFPWPPDGRYYLVDAGYSNYGAFLAPYRGVSYDIPEICASGGQARDSRELFNYRHSQLRNCVERCFGLLKSRFSSLRWGMPSYAIPHQTDLVLACCVLHNYVRRFDIDDPLFDGTYPHNEDDELIFSKETYPMAAQIEAQGHFRDEIANALWANQVD